jgi:hypothetical protein
MVIIRNVENSSFLYIGFILFVDSVIRAAYYKYFYPKEALILDGVLNRAIAENAHQMASNAPPTRNKKNQNAVVVDKSLRAQVARYKYEKEKYIFRF